MFHSKLDNHAGQSNWEMMQQFRRIAAPGTNGTNGTWNELSPVLSIFSLESQNANKTIKANKHIRRKAIKKNMACVHSKTTRNAVEQHDNIKKKVNKAVCLFFQPVLFFSNNGCFSPFISDSPKVAFSLEWHVWSEYLSTINTTATEVSARIFPNANICVIWSKDKNVDIKITEIDPKIVETRGICVVLLTFPSQANSKPS